MIIEDLNVKPCPMCGSKPRTWNWNHGAMVECWCKDHHIQCEAKTLEEALKAWNRRTDGIIRCKDCAYYEQGTPNNKDWCKLHCTWCDDGEGYCSRGRRK